MSEFKFDDLPEETAVTAAARDFLLAASGNGDVQNALEEFCAQLGDAEDQDAAWKEMQMRLGREQFQKIMRIFAD